MERKPVDFLTFFVLWSRFQGWTVPLLHVRMCVWLETCTEPERVLMVFRGAAKSTIYAVYKAWKLYRNTSRRSLVWSADGPTAEMLTADVINVLRNHPLTATLLAGRKPGKKRFWVNGAKDARNASMRSVGVDSNATGARADDVDFDDIEVPGNIETPEAREKLRHRIGDSTHILVPGGQATYIGTPHTMNSIYPEQIAAGAAVLKIPLFAHAVRFTEGVDKRTAFAFPHEIGPDGLYVMGGIHKGARLLEEGKDYQLRKGHVVFAKPPGMVIDIASCCAWPERFTREEIALRRRKTRTLNGWDSQYMLEAKPLTEVRLDPDRLKVYAVEPRFLTANKILTCWLGSVQIVGCSLRWDPSSGNLNSDASAAVLDLQDGAGRHYWHRAAGLTGEVAETDTKGVPCGGQVWQLCDLIETFKVPRVTVETNGIGGFAPAFLKAALKKRNLRCAVKEVDATQNKNTRILEALEPLIQSGMLWVHTSVNDGGLYEQMKSWNPTVRNQPDDLLDAGAGAVTDQPARIGQFIGNPTGQEPDDWRPSAAAQEYELEA
jgi:hypothetical protein